MWYLVKGLCEIHNDHVGTSCSGCVEGKCDINSGSCHLGCKSGYYRNSTTDHCLACMTNCAACTAYNTCTSCTDGFYITTNVTCKTCPLHCKNGTICNKINGYCEGGCNDLWSGEQCFDKCASGCKQCSQTNTLSCGICDQERYGDGCEHNCSPSCKTENTCPICNKNNGSCSIGCIDGTWGETCENNCGIGCTGGLCNRATGYCLNSCSLNYFGDMCDKQCSENCLRITNDSSARRCSEASGHCTFGCQPGWFGENCKHTCSSYCIDVECFRSNGSCIYGCLDGYSGSKCDKRDQGMTISDILIVARAFSIMK